MRVMIISDTMYSRVNQWTLYTHIAQAFTQKYKNKFTKLNINHTYISYDATGYDDPETHRSDKMFFGSIYAVYIKDIIQWPP